MTKKKKTTAKKSIDMIAIGESLRDVFYTIHQASVNCSIDKARCLLCLEYAEKIPIESVVKVPAAGNSANAAVGASRLGLQTALVTWVGADTAGDAIRQALKEDRVDNRYVLIDKTTPTSEATILSYEGERTQLVYFQPRKYVLPKLVATKCIYYSAMGEKHRECDKAILKELARQKNAFFAFQPGTTHIKHGLTPTFKALLKRADLFILNKDESHQLLGNGERTIMNLLEAFHKYGSKTVVITDGKQGAFGYDGERYLQIPIFDGEPKERTGAGDSFATGVTVALLKKQKLEDALRWGTANGWSVVQFIGPQAGLLTTAGMKRTLKRYSKIKAKEIKI